jgi:hypothetical protein
MANVRTILSRLSYVPTATQADASFPVTALSDAGHPFRPWKAMASGGLVNVTLDADNRRQSADVILRLLSGSRRRSKPGQLRGAVVLSGQAAFFVPRSRVNG